MGKAHTLREYSVLREAITEDEDEEDVGYLKQLPKSVNRHSIVVVKIHAFENSYT